LSAFHWKHLFVADAFENMDYLHFMVKGTLAGLACYVFFSSVDWHGLGNSLTTCVITALTTIGSSRQKQILRFAGAILGGLIFGMGAQIYFLPWQDTIFGFTVLFVVVTALAAWLTTASPRLSFLGVQMALAFYLIMFQSSAIEVSLFMSRDFVLGTLLGLFAMWGIFDQLWAKPAIEEMREAFAANMRHLGELNQTVFSPLASGGKLDVLREKMNEGFSKMSGNADMIVFEVGHEQAEHFYWRSRLEDWQNTQESLFLAQLAVHHYHGHLMFSEWPENLADAYRRFNNGLVDAWESVAAYLTDKSKPLPRQVQLNGLWERLQQVAMTYAATRSDEQGMDDLRAILELEKQMVVMTRRLSQDILSA
jgi:multidrug resistance protein MdtO